MDSLKTAKRKAQDVRPRPSSAQKSSSSTSARPGLPLFLSTPRPILPKLEVGSIDDPLEHEADQAADHVLRAPGDVQSSSSNSHGQPSSSAVPSVASPRVEQVLSEGGQPLDSATRSFFEPRFGMDFGEVRVHTGENAAQSAHELGALGYTSGEHIVFGKGQFAPTTGAGRRLLAHELSHVSQMQGTAVGNKTIRRQVYGPPVSSGAGSGFDLFLLQFEALESAAIADGYGFNERITAFRKVFYDSASAAKTYAGATVGGGVWNILIPGAAGTALPPSWSNPTLKGSVDYLKANQVLTINGKQVDIGHMLAGADAAAHPTNVSLAGGMVKMRSNVEASTFIGDLGSVVGEYIHGSTASFRDTAMERSPLLESYYDRDPKHAMASSEDMAGNADAYALSFNSSKSLTANLRDYYAATAGGARKRFTTFASKIGLGTLSGSKFSGDTAVWRSAITDEVFNAALAYAAGKGWRGDVINVFNDPGPGIFTPTFWEMYMNNSEWVVDIFVNRIVSEASKE
jgi:hypothetical protein